MKIRITTRGGKFWFVYGGQTYHGPDLACTMQLARSLILHIYSLQLNAYTNSSIVLHA